jgi:chromosomal replication initiator protein
MQVDSNLNPNYSFDNFVEGDSNRLARSAGFAVANKPGGTAFNPLLIYGGVGLGKTHLAHAIGIEIKNKYEDKTVLYVSSEKFTHQFIDAVKNNTVNDFTHFYQMIDVLIIDDVQRHKMYSFTSLITCTKPESKSSFRATSHRLKCRAWSNAYSAASSGD